MTVLYGVLSLAEVFTLGGVSKVKSVGTIAVTVGSRVAVGSGFSKRLSSSLIYGSVTKSAEKLARQMRNRGWTKESVGELVDDAFTTRKSTNKARGNNPATVYYDEKGNYVVVDDVTNEVVQISDRFDPEWNPDNTIIDPYMP